MVGITSVHGSALPLAERFARIKAAGFDAILLWWGNSGADSRRELVEQARSSGLYIENVHAPTDDLNVLWLDDPKGDERLSFLCEQVSDCAKYGIGTIVMHVTTGDGPPPVSDIGTERLGRLIEHAAHCHVRVAFENVRTAAHVCHILDRFHSPYAGFCYDSGHELLWTPEVDWLSKYGSRVFAIHLHDNCGDRDAHMIPFDGDINWERKAKQLAASAYTGAMTIESQVHTSGRYQPEDFDAFLDLACRKSMLLADMIAASR